MKKLLIPFLATGVVLLVSGLCWASASPPCPAIGAANGCNVLVTLNSGGTATVTTAGQQSTPYDGVEDQLVGVVNNSGGTVSAIIVSGTGIGGFDNDGAWSSTCVASGPNTYGCGTPTQSGNVGGYQGPLTTFSGVSANQVTVTFNGGLAAGGTSYFSLEEPPSTSGFTVTITPEPASLLLGVIGFGLLGFFGLRHKFAQA